MDLVRAHPEQPDGDKRFRLLIESITDYAIYMLDEQGCVTTWNAGAQRLKGYTASEILGHHFSTFYTLADRQAGMPAKALETAAREGRFETDGWRVRKDGSLFFANVVIDPVRDEHGHLIGFAKITRDMTERRAAQEALRQSEERFRLLVQGVTDYAIYMLDPHGVVASWNPGARRFKGYTEEEIIGQHFSRFYTDEDRQTDLPKRALETALREGKFEQEGWRIRKDGSRMWAHVVIDPIRDDQGHLIGFAKVTRDISDREAAQEALRRSEERFRLLVQGVTDYAIYMLDPEGRVVNWNSGAQRLKGYQEHEIVGQHFSTFYTSEDREAGLPALALETAAREGRFEKEGWRVRKDGTRFFAHVIVDAIQDEQGDLIGFAKVTRDITERKQAQEELEKARAETHQSQKLAAIAQLASGIAHDFNNLLTVVMGNLDMLKRAKEERRPRLIDNALHAVEQARRLTGRLLAFSRRQTLVPEPVDLNGMIAGMDDMLTQSLRGDIRLEFDLAERVWPVEVDPTQLQIALINLAVNARDAMPKAGTFRVKTENIVLRHGQMREAVAISLTDTGVGISEEALPQVFEPFFTTKEVGKGTGLGLAQVYGFTQQSGGTVDIRSEVGRGTTVTLYLPKANAPAKKLDENVDMPVAESRPLRILLVEDNPQVADVAVALLAEHGHAITHASTGDEALARLHADPTFDLVFSDMVMPGDLDGLDLAHRIQAKWPTLPVLLATGYSDAANRATEEGFTLLTKPYQPDALLTAIREVTTVGRRTASNVIPLARTAP
ncbi:PAS domain-containing hybrid sensor histidine kinase/response regulator [Microvirga calopogonii]|uniref:PAS domain-containing hybrid sensor histidine kinase/response regulator n=1 Tax=Microvirga calopogonii TaxID=2078013 RepID=UPI0013B3E5A1|nr:PAS domain-containing sensor histidine kinase [Microvirga calopogonii]